MPQKEAPPWIGDGIIFWRAWARKGEAMMVAQRSLRYSVRDAALAARAARQAAQKSGREL
jgi:hypothetical protein